MRRAYGRIEDGVDPEARGGVSVDRFGARKSRGRIRIFFFLFLVDFFAIALRAVSILFRTSVWLRRRRSSLRIAPWAANMKRGS